jgi:hypothetical protein
MDSRFTAAAVSCPTAGEGLGGCGMEVCAGPGPRMGVKATSSAESEFRAAESSYRHSNLHRQIGHHPGSK